MSQGNRPGGLTALAVINFVWGGVGCLVTLLSLLGLGVANEASDGEVAAEMASNGAAMSIILLSLLTVGLLIASGVGYLGLKKTLGYKMGNFYAVVSIALSVLIITLGEGGFGIFSILGFIYPALTLFLLNTVFKEDFVN